MKNYMTPLRFRQIKSMLTQEDATIESVARQAHSAWATVQKVSRAASYKEYKGLPVEEKTPDTVSLKPATIVERLKEQKAKINEHFDAVIGAIEHFKL